VCDTGVTAHSVIIWKVLYEGGGGGGRCPSMLETAFILAHASAYRGSRFLGLAMKAPNCFFKFSRS